uniref:PHM7_cyt domain-containing protein n=1 Tax=Panagrellus redivivus TaxID=6233 RepID=A0A7E4WD13_PANRE
MPTCIVAECEVVAKWARFVIFYSITGSLALFLPVAIWCAVTKASFVFYRVWKCIHDRSDGLRPTFSNAKKIAEVTWSELYYTQRQIERSRLEISKELSKVDHLRRSVHKDLAGFPLTSHPSKQVYFVEPRTRPSSSSTSSSSWGTSC